MDVDVLIKQVGVSHRIEFILSYRPENVYGRAWVYKYPAAWMVDYALWHDDGEHQFTTYAAIQFATFKEAREHAQYLARQLVDAGIDKSKVKIKKTELHRVEK